MNRVVLAIAVGLGSFVLSMAGVYFALPMLAPHVVEAARTPADSLAADSLLAATDSLRTDTSAAGASAAPDAGGGSLVAAEDTVAVLRRRLRQAEEAAAARRASVQAAEERLAVLRAQRAGASELSATLAELEDAELAAILRRLDLPILKRLYAEASSRNRKRLLKAMPADRAAHFVSQIVTADAPADAAASKR